MRFGIHAGPQDCTVDELRQLWPIADERGFSWCSVWDHLYSVSDLSNPAKPCLDAVATMAALATATRNVQVGCLVFCVGYRNPGVLAKAAVTIDHLSGGRAALGLGCGWNENEFRAFGIPFLPIKQRLDQLEEHVVVVKRLLAGERVTFAGEHVQLADAICVPGPVRGTLPIWIGGQGEKRLLRMVAKYADGWNVPFLAPEVYTQRNGVLNRWCDTERRDPAAIVRSVNVGLAIGRAAAAVQRQEDNLRLMFGGMTDWVKPGVLTGTPAQVIDRIGEYQRAGVEQLILALRAPFDLDALGVFVDDVMPAFR